jgi:hypothetical protein
MANWRGNLISTVAKWAAGNTFTEAEVLAQLRDGGCWGRSSND